MKIAHTFAAEARDGSGKGAARALRRASRVPAIIYGLSKEPVKVSLPVKELTLAYHKGAFFSKIVELNFAGKKVHALPRDVQTHPVSDQIEHADFQQVDETSKIHVMVPVKVIGSEKSIGIKRGGVLNLVRHEIELICSPSTIPASIDIDIKDMNIGSSVHIKDVALPKDVSTAIKRNFTIATIAGRKAEEEVQATVAATDAAAPAAGAAAPAAGAKAAAPAAGAKADAKPAAKK